MSEDLLDRLRRENPVSQEMAPLPIEVVLRRLDHEPPAEPAHARRRYWWTRRLTATVPLAVSLLVVVAVAAVVVVGLGRRHAGTPSTSSSSAAGSRAALIQMLGVLRTPQTKTERTTTSLAFLGEDQRLEQIAREHPSLKSQIRQSLVRDGYVRVDRALVRIVSLSQDGSLTIIPLTYRPSTQSPKRAEGLGLALRVPGSPAESLSPTSIAALRDQGLNLFTYARGYNVGAVVVPDGVATVTLDAFQVTSRVRVNPALIPHVSAVVRRNVAAFRLTAPTVMTHGGRPGEGAPGMYSTGAYAHMTWLGADGTVIKRAKILLAFNFIVKTPKHGNS